MVFMDTVFIINMSVAVIVVLGILVAYHARKRPGLSKKGSPQKPPNYEAFFVLGISFLPLGFIFAAAIGNPGFLGLSALGIIYMAIGLSNMGKGRLAEARKKMAYAEDVGAVGDGSGEDSGLVKMPDRLKAPAIMKAKNKPVKKARQRRN